MPQFFRTIFGGLMALSAAATQSGVPVAAQEGCDRALIRDYRKEDRRFSENISFLTLSESRRQQGQTKSETLEIPIKGIPVKGNRSDVSNFYENLASRAELNIDRKAAVEIVLATLSDNAVNAYKACLESGGYAPLRAWFKDITATSLILEMQWRPIGPDTKPHKPVIVDITGGSYKSEALQAIQPNSKSSLIIKRSPKEDLRITVRVGDYSQSVSLPYIPDVDIRWQRLSKKNPEITIGGIDVHHAENIAPSPGRLIDIRSVNANVTRPLHDGCGRTSPDRIYARVDQEKLTSFNAVVEVRAAQSAPNCGARIYWSTEWVELEPRVFVDGKEIK